MSEAAETVVCAKCGTHRNPGWLFKDPLVEGAREPTLCSRCYSNNVNEYVNNLPDAEMIQHTSKAGGLISQTLVVLFLLGTIGLTVGGLYQAQAGNDGRVYVVHRFSGSVKVCDLSSCVNVDRVFNASDAVQGGVGRQ